MKILSASTITILTLSPFHTHSFKSNLSRVGFTSNSRYQENSRYGHQHCPKRTIPDFGRWNSLYSKYDINIPLKRTQRMSIDEESSNIPEYLPLSPSDIARLSEMRSRHSTIPIMILDAMLPGQCIQFGSSDERFHKLIEHVLRDGGFGELGMIGINPHTGRPLSIGVTVSISKENIKLDPDNGALVISVRGNRRFEVQDEPWLDHSGSFYLADVEIVENREERLSSEDEKSAVELSSTIPELVERWFSWIIKSGICDVEGMQMRIKDIGPMPDEVGRRALWVAALLNPLPALEVCLEIRPAMLACKNDFERMSLATTAMQSSIDHLSGKRRLF